MNACRAASVASLQADRNRARTLDPNLPEFAKMKALIVLVALLALSLTSHRTVSAQKKPGDPIKGVIEVDLKNFRAVLDDTASRSVLVEFYAPWCGHCKTLAPEMERLAAHYLADPSLMERVTLAKVDADQWHELGSIHEVEGFPTVKWIPQGGTSKDGKVYDGPLTATGILNYIQEELRALDGFARVSQLTSLAEQLVAGGDAEALLDEAKTFVRDSVEETTKANGALYVRYMERFATKGGVEYVDKEVKRLQRLGRDGMSPAKQAEVDRKISVLTTFQAAQEE